LFDPTTYASRALTVAAELVADDERVDELRRVLAVIHDDLVGTNTDPERVAQQRSALDAAGQPVDNDIFLPARLPDTHFTRFVIVDDQRGPPDNKLPLVLVWESNHDGAAVDYLRKVLDLASRPGSRLDFDQVFGACLDYPGMASGDEWVEWMLARSIRAEAFYSGYRGVPKAKVDAAGRVHAAIRAFLDDQRAALAGKPALEIHAAVRDHLKTPAAKLEPGDLEPAVERGLGFRLRKWSTLVLLGVAVLLLVTVLAPFTIGWYLTLRRREQTDKPDRAIRAVHGLPDLIAVEDRIVQNQLTHLVDLKPGVFRYFTQRVVLLAIDQLARIIFVNGNLGGITSIHFARWVILHDRRPVDPDRRRHRLLFFSNYDFSWDSYLGEFVDRASRGLTAVWSNTEGYPRTRRLTEEGASDEETFKQWARDRQIASQVWWSGVRYSSVENVNTDVAVHRGVGRTLDEDDAERWLLSC
jgi:hypothetical protein